MCFLPPNSQLPTPFRFRLSVSHETDRRTDGRTDRQRPSVHNARTLRGRGIVIEIRESRVVGYYYYYYYYYYY